MMRKQRRNRKHTPKRRARLGSVLIMVVALLVLLALMGTAWIATVRNERSASTANVYNTQIEMLARGVGGMVSAHVAGGVLGHDNSVDAPGPDEIFFRPRSGVGGKTYTYAGYDYAGYDWGTHSVRNGAVDHNFVHANEFLASRVPSRKGTGASATYHWPAITAPFASDENRDTSRPWLADRVFESPYVPQGSTYPLEYQQRLDVEISEVAVTINGTTLYHPAFLINNVRHLAADTDRDGIADAGLVRLPMSQQNGVTYYYAARIIDNNGAVNASTAMKWASRVNAGEINAAAPMTDLLPSNVSIEQMLVDGLEADRTTKSLVLDNGPEGQLKAYNQYRFHILDDSYNPTNGFTTNHYERPYADPASGSQNATDISSEFKFISVFDALWHQMGSRIDNPGYVAADLTYRPIPVSSQIALANGFVLYNPKAVSDLEDQLSGTLFTGGREITNPYKATPQDLSRTSPPNSQDPSRLGWWENFDYSDGNLANYSRRPLIVARNGISNAVAAATLNDYSNVDWTAPDGMADNNKYHDLPVKASLNTSPFKDLWLAYWNVMVEDPQDADDPTPFADSTLSGPNESVYYGMNWGKPDASGDPTSQSRDRNEHKWRMFRSSLRPAAGEDEYQTALRFRPAEQVRLRAALAAANTAQLRYDRTEYVNGQTKDNEAAVPELMLPIAGLGTAVSQATVRIYGNRPQPFITELYANNNTSTPPTPDPNDPDPAPQVEPNPDGYVALELFNPYGESISLQGWHLVAVDRARTGTNKSLTITHIANLSNKDDCDPPTIGARESIPSRGFVVFENHEPGKQTSNARHRPKSAGAVTGARYYVPNLHKAIGKELLLVRPASGTAFPNVRTDVAVTDDYYTFDEFARAAVPVDSIDLTGMPPKSGKIGNAKVWHYARQCNDSKPFQCVYPGQYYGDRTKGPRQQGTITHEFDVESSRVDRDLVIQHSSLGDDSNGYIDEDFTIQIANTDSPGPFGTRQSHGLVGYPFGGFARNGDVLQVPFIGSYVVFRLLGTDPANPADPNNPKRQVELYEMNPVTIDSAFAEDTDPDDDEVEAIGRFAPIIRTKEQESEFPGHVNDFDAPASGATFSTRWRYRWAMRVFDYLTVHAPHEDYNPNVPREVLKDTTERKVSNVANVPAGQVNGDADRESGVQGLININTAPLPVLASIPWAVRTDGSIDEDENRAIARAIIKFRDEEGKYFSGGDNTERPVTEKVNNGNGGYGPFKTIFDLYRVKEVRDWAQGVDATGDATDEQGDFSPLGNSGANSGLDKITPDQATNDFEERFLFLNRVSNMITTRSDHFTAYILVQGWRGAGTDRPELVAQRRFGLIIDRSGITRTKKNVRTILVPME